MREEQPLIAEILHDKSLGEDVSSALAEYLRAQARYTNALADRKLLEVENIKNPPKPKEEELPEWPPAKSEKALSATRRVPKTEDNILPW